MVLVGGVISTKVVIALTTFAEALATLWREWAPTIGLIHPMDHCLDISSFQLMVGGLHRRYILFSGGRSLDFTITLPSFSTFSFSDYNPSFSASTP